MVNGRRRKILFPFHRRKQVLVKLGRGYWCHINVVGGNLCPCLFMPRKARIDAPGALYHVIVRGIERRSIFRDSKDYERFLDRLG